MTERAAIYTLQMNRPFAYNELQDAVDMAISALEKQEKLKQKQAYLMMRFESNPREEISIFEVMRILTELEMEEGK